MFVAKVRRLKEETFTFTEMKDIEDLIVTTMGEDVWLAILEFTQSKNEELEEELEDLRSGTPDDEACIDAHRRAISEAIDKCEDFIKHIDTTKRLDRKGLKTRINKIQEILEDGYE